MAKKKLGRPRKIKPAVLEPVVEEPLDEDPQLVIDEPQEAEEPASPAGDPLPLEDSEQHKIEVNDAISAIVKLPEAEDCEEPADFIYRIKSGPVRGYWKIGRHFTKEPTDLLASELSEGEIIELERANPLHVVIEKIAVED